MKLSIIVPVYKAENYLHECVDSLLAQTVADFEIILVNDGSPDNSAKIMEEYRAKYSDIIKTLHLENGGQGRARNHAIEIAQGEYLGFVDSDDYIDPSMYTKLIDAAEKENAQIAVCSIKQMFDDGRENVYVSWDKANPLFAAGSCCDKVFSRELVGDLRFPEGLWYEDFELSAKLIMKAEKIAFVDEALYVYRCGQPSTMNNSNTRKNLNIIKVMDSLKEFALANARIDDFEYLLVNHVLLDSVKRVASQKTEDKSAVLKELRGYVKENIPKLFACSSFKNESRNRRIIMALNYYGLHDLALAILKMK